MKILRKVMLMVSVSMLALPALAAPATFAQPQTGGFFNEPPKTFTLHQGWYKDRETFYYDFGANSQTLNGGKAVARPPVYVFVTGFDAAGKPQMVSGQTNVIDVVPGDPGYSDLWEMTFVTVPAGYVPNTLKSADDIMKSGYPMKATGVFVNCPVVPAGSRLSEPWNGSTEPHKGWYKGRDVYYFEFGPSPDYTIPVYVFITGMDADGKPQFLAGQTNIIDAIPSDPGYSAFWEVVFVKAPSGYKPNSIKSADAIMKSGYEMIRPGMVVNCPVTRTADAVMSKEGGMMDHPESMSGENAAPGMPKTGEGDPTLPLWALVAGCAMLGAGLLARRKLAPERQ